MDKEEEEKLNKRFNYLKSKRENIFTSIQLIHTKSKTLTLDTLDSFTPQYERLSKIEDKFEEIQEEIIDFNSLFEKESLPVESVQKSFYDLFFDIKGKYFALEKTRGPRSQVSAPSQPANPLHVSSVPVLKIPMFTGDMEDWENFIALYDVSIHTNSRLSNSEKFAHLRAHLDGRALATISNFHVSEENYQTAYDCLVDRYKNKNRLANLYISQIRKFDPLKTPSYDSLQKYLKVHQNSVYALKSLKIPDLADFILFNLSFHNLDPATQKEFKSFTQPSVTPSHKELIDFVSAKTQNHEIYSSDEDVKEKSKPRLSAKGNFSHVLVATSQNLAPTEDTSVRSQPPQRFPCPLCKGAHNLQTCAEFAKKSVDERFNIVKELKRCFNCLGNHFSSACRSRFSCQHCRSGRHHSLLHRERSSQPSESEDSPPSKGDTSSVEGSAKSVALSCQFSEENPSIVLLGTVKAHIRDAYGNFCAVRAVVDSGSQVSIISKNLAHKLGLNVGKSPVNLVGIANSAANPLGVVSCSLRPATALEPLLSTQAIVLPKISENLPSCEVSKSTVAKFKSLELADPDYNKPCPVEFLIGADLYPSIFNSETLNGPSLIQGNPSAFRTIFGWMVVGKTSDVSLMSVAPLSLFTTTALIENLIRKFWEVEEVPEKQISDPSEDYCERHFQKTHFRDESGRYVVSLPFAPQADLPGYNRAAVLKGYQSLEKRLILDPQKKNDYHNFLKEYVDLGHMSPAKQPSQYIIPHSAVYKKDSSKIRVVFNGSFKDSTQKSLNDRLLCGPRLQKHIFLILTSFRLHPVALCADLKMMYRQVLLNPDDRKYQHILWRPSSTSEILEFELNTVTYGLAPSAFQAIRTLKQLVNDEGELFPLASSALLNDTYVDDIVSGAEDVQTAQQLQQELIGLLGRGGFELRKWLSNSDKVLSDIPTEHIEPVMFSDDQGEPKILGLFWNPRADNFTYRAQPFKGTPSKRSILSFSAQLFDPLGWLSPVIFWVKYFLQRLWLEKIDWDDALPAELEANWRLFCTQIVTLEKIKIPRHSLFKAKVSKLVGFSDASVKGYAAVIYLHTETKSGVSVSFIIAKSRVAPLKVMTIPRLELMGALLLTRLTNSILSAFPNFDLHDVYLFTDSTLVLLWLATPSHCLKTFVGNRVEEITTSFPAERWSHVNSTENPADVGSRGALPSNLIENSLWWQGPQFLNHPFSQWPSKPRLEVIEDLPEVKPVSISLLSAVENENLVDLTSRFSSFERARKVTAHMLRFIFNSRKPKAGRTQFPSNPTYEELENATQKLIGSTQSFHFAETLSSLRKDKMPKEKTLWPLSPFLDPQGLLRVGGRLRHSELPFSAKHPLLIPRNSHLARLLCKYFHEKHLHAGIRALQPLILEKYWIVGLRSLMRKVIFTCPQCRRFRVKPSQPFMGDLPASRVIVSRPFERTGIDLAGPFSIKFSLRKNAAVSKGYLVVFVCFSTKAVHLEAVSDLSTPALLAAFDRFTARRSFPSEMYSDCGKNLIGASNCIKEAYEYLEANHDKIFSRFPERKVAWHFNPPYAPNFGGLWEAAVKSAKSVLIRTVGLKPLTFEEFSTLLYRIEAIMNSRPLCAVSSDPNEITDFLTPGHFLVGSNLLSPPEIPLEENLTYRSRWKRVSELSQRFWKVWSKEYLHTLIQRPKWQRSTPNLKVNDLVFMYGENTHPLHWPLAQIEAVHPGEDGIIRVVTLRTPKGLFKRAVNRVAPVPLN